MQSHARGFAGTSLPIKNLLDCPEESGPLPVFLDQFPSVGLDMPVTANEQALAALMHILLDEEPPGRLLEEHDDLTPALTHRHLLQVPNMLKAGVCVSVMGADRTCSHPEASIHGHGLPTTRKVMRVGTTRRWPTDCKARCCWSLAAKPEVSTTMRMARALIEANKSLEMLVMPAYPRHITHKVLAAHGSEFL